MIAIHNPLTTLSKTLMRFFLFTILIGMLASCESRRTIVNGQEEKEANEILVFLSSKGVDASKIQAISEGAGGGRGAILWNISVPSSQANEAMALLNQVGLPRRRGQNLLGIFSNVGLVPSGMEQKIRYQAGLAEQIANTIRKIDGVLDADVQISFPEEDPLNPNAQKQKITASVYVKHTGVLDDPNAHLVTRIKRLVAGSVPGLDYDNVTVIGDRARFSETSGFQGNVGEQEKNYVNVWSLIIAKDSLTRFRIIFFTFTISLLLLIMALTWLLWKFYPILREVGGFKQLFTSYHPIHPEDLTHAPTEIAKEDEEGKKPEEKAEDESTIEHGVDET
ncbi:MAG: type III secretion inner membrane ring lipoprotein SctJ [Parachlamydiaceae bacterium]|nr:type III secretion inner membrane ring lipoprotein SctJ [Parachlamydiaceae bacterium]